MRRWLWLARQVARRLWVRATLIGFMGIVAAGVATVADRFMPWDISGKIGAAAVDDILTIIASSMLAVTTFSLSVMTSAFASATSNVTPRAIKLLMEDRATQNTLSTFVGSFLFSIVGIVVLKTGAYGDRGRVILFIVTIGVIALIVVSLLRWIDYLMRLGRVGETTARVEEATRRAIEARLALPWLGGVPLAGVDRAVPARAETVRADKVGYVQHIDVPALAGCGERVEGRVFVAVLPGSFVYPDSPLAWIEVGDVEPGEEPAGKKRAGEEKAGAAAVDDALRDGVRTAFTIADERSYDQDPRFGLTVLSEIGSRALSPAVNDPGTAIDVIGRTVRLLSLWAAGCAAEPSGAPRGAVRHPRVLVPPLDTADLFADAFAPIARDGAALVEVQLRLQKGLAALSRSADAGVRAAARHQAALALERAETALALEADKVLLRAAAVAARA